MLLVVSQPSRKMVIISCLVRGAPVPDVCSPSPLDDVPVAVDLILASDSIGRRVGASQLTNVAPSVISPASPPDVVSNHFFRKNTADFTGGGLSSTAHVSQLVGKSLSVGGQGRRCRCQMLVADDAACRRRYLRIMTDSNRQTWQTVAAPSPAAINAVNAAQIAVLDTNLSAITGFRCAAEPFWSSTVVCRCHRGVILKAIGVVQTSQPRRWTVARC